MSEDAQVWCSNLLANYGAFGRLDFGVPLPWPEGFWGWRRFTCGRIAAEELPEVFTLKSSDSLPEVFGFRAGLIIGESTKTLLEGFALGETQIIPIRVVNSVRQPLKQVTYLLNIAECRSLVVAEQCAKGMHHPNGVWTISGANMALDLAVRGDPPDGLDMWFDPVLEGIIFLTAPLAAAIKAAKIRNFKVFPCRQAV